MGIRIRCPKCHKAIDAPAEYAGKRAKCRCGARFIVPVPGAAHAAAASAAPAAAHVPAASAAIARAALPSDSLLEMLDAELCGGPAIAAPGTGPLAPVIMASPAEPAMVPPAGRRPPQAKGFGRILACPLAVGVGVMALWYALGSVLFLAVVGTRLEILILIPPAVLAVVGGVLSGLGFCHPAAKRPGPYGPWVRPWVRPRVMLCSIVAVILILCPVALFVAVKGGLWRSAVSREVVRSLVVVGLPCAIGACVVAIWFIFFQSIEMRWRRAWGALGAASITYLAFLPALMVLGIGLLVCEGAYFVVFALLGALN